MTFNAPDIDYAGLSPVIALTGGLCIVLLLGLIPRLGRFTMAYLTIVVLAATAGLSIWQWGETTWWPRRCGSTPSAWRRP
jgi:NADH-quinone oxidoreductase subunit N